MDSNTLGLKHECSMQERQICVGSTVARAAGCDGGGLLNTDSEIPCSFSGLELGVL